MRQLTACAFGFMMLAAGCAAQAPRGPVLAASVPNQSPSQQHRSRLFVSPMGEPFYADPSGARGVDLWFTEADINYDTRISHDEFMTNAAALFATIDADHDGALTPAEAAAYWRARAPELTGEHGDAGAQHASPGDVLQVGAAPRARGAAQPDSLLGDVQPIMTCDQNLDQRVTLAEFRACAEQRFALIDSNHDGFFTPDEVRFRSAGIDRIERADH